MDDGRGKTPSARSESTGEVSVVLHRATNDGLEGEENWPAAVSAGAGGRRREEDEERIADVVVVGRVRGRAGGISRKKS